MKIVIATPFIPPHSGVLAQYAEGLKRAFEKRGERVEVVSWSDLKHIPKGIRHLLYFYRVYVQAENADFVLALDTWSVGLPALIAARTRGIPCAVRIGGDFLWESFVERTKESVLLSEFYDAKRKLSLKERIIRAGTEWLLRNAIPLFTTKFQREIWHRAYGTSENANIVENYFPSIVGTYLPSRGPVFVSAGRSIGLKNRALLQKIITRLKDSHPGLELDTRLLPPEEHGKRLADSYAVVVASFSEVCSNTAIDAMTLGKPFICPKDTGTSERLHECGLFVDTRSESALTFAIESLLDPLQYEKLAKAARSFSFTHSFEEMVEEIIKVVTLSLKA